MRRPEQIPLAYMEACSDNSLEALELAQMAYAKEQRDIAHQAIEKAVLAEVTARVAESLRKGRLKKAPQPVLLEKAG